ncbi:MAG: nucleotidyltransferase domain-containing protein [Anaerolineae bacterium]|nr:nucleotidyltransferase domain-containing protein [Thermoflexales bacterium]MDW8395423.1 nucleotidyltransferase domain-containing protein [Anaerolineae bacterium]
MTLALEPSQLKTVCAILRRRVPHAAVFVFGSRAAGSPKPHADLDLLLRADEPIDPLTFAELCADFEESDLPFRVDVLDYHTTDPAFLRLILPQCILISDHEPIHHAHQPNRPASSGQH